MNRMHHLILLLILAPSVLIAKPLSVSNSQAVYRVDRFVHVLTPAPKTFSASEIMRPEFRKRFHPNRWQHAIIKPSPHPTWLHFTISNTAPTSSVYYINFPHKAIPSIRIFISGTNNQPRETPSIRDYKRNRPLNLFRIELPASRQVTVYARVVEEKILNVAPVRLVAESRMDSMVQRTDFGRGIFTGICLIMILYNLFIYSSIRERSYLLYILNIFIVFLLSISLDDNWGFNIHHIVGLELIPILHCLTSAIMILFTKGFLNLKKNQPRANRYLTGLLLFIAFGIPLFIIGATSRSRFLMKIVTIYMPAQLLLTSISLLTVGIMMVTKGQRSARYYLIGRAGFVSGLLAFPLFIEGIIPHGFWSQYGLHVGASLDMLFLALALADRFRRLRLENEAMQEAHLKELETKVLQRTEELHESEKQYRGLVENSPFAIGICSQEGIVSFVNRACMAMLGTEDDSFIIGEQITRFLPDEDRKEGIVAFNRALERDALGRERNILCMDGSMLEVEIFAIPFKTRGRDAVQIVLVDISRKKQIEKNLRNARIQSDRANREKSRFLANMSHELRTPLNAILGYSQLLRRDDSISGDSRKNLQIINRSGQHLLELINTVLDMSKIEAGQLELEYGVFDLREMADNLESLMHFRAEKKGLSLQFTIAEETPRYIRTDEKKLRQVIINLVNNAIKFTRDGSVSVHIQSEKKPKNTTAALHFQVSDTGSGIAEEDLDTIFKAFEQLEGQDSRTEGTGLGLAISRQLIRLMGGDIDVKSRLGEGTTFHFSIRIETAEKSDIVKKSPALSVVGLDSSSDKEFRLLIADDNEDNRNLLAEIVRITGFTVRQAANGEEAVQLQQEWKPHLIWMDLKMPVMDGFEAMQRIQDKCNETGEKPPVIIVLTATVFEQERKRAFSLGCSDFIRKPFEEREIFDALKKHLGVEYVYQQTNVQTEKKASTRKIPLDTVITDLKSLPPDIADHLKEALELSDVEQIEGAMLALGQENPILAEVLSPLVNDFAFDRILKMMEADTDK